MSTRALAWTATLLTVLLAVAAGLLLSRLGVGRSWEEPRFEFENPLLTVRKGQRAVIRPIVQGAPMARYFFSTPQVEPDPEEDSYPAPYVPVAVEMQAADSGEWRFPQFQFVVLSLLGGLTTKLWFEEARPVRERGPDGVERVVMRLRFGHESGAIVDYFFDPDHPVPGFGWYRHEFRGTEGPPAFYFAADAGRVEVD